MGEFSAFGKMLIFFGIILIVVGGLFLFGSRVPFFGRMPGDIVIQKKNISMYFPITTCIIVSIILSLIMWLVGRK